MSVPAVDVDAPKEKEAGAGGSHVTAFMLTRPNFGQHFEIGECVVSFTDDVTLLAHPRPSGAS